MEEMFVKKGYEKIGETIHIEPIMTIDEAKQILRDNLQNIQRDTSLSIRLAIEVLLNYVNVLENEARANQEEK